MKNGFSLVEVVVVIAILSVIMTITVASFSDWRDRNNLELARRNIESTLKLARSRSLASEGGKSWGVLFNEGFNPPGDYSGPHYFQICATPEQFVPGSVLFYSCNPSTTSGITNLPSNISFCTTAGHSQELKVSVLWGVPAVVFEQLTGAFGNINQAVPPSSRWLQEGTIYVYNKNKISSPCGNATNISQCLGNKTCAGVSITGAGVIKNPSAVPGTLYAYLIDDNDRKLKVIDVTNPSSPTVAGQSMAFGTDLTALWVDKGYAYVADAVSSSDSRIWKINVQNPNPGTPLSSANIDNGTEAYASDIFVSGDYVYVIFGFNRISSNEGEGALKWYRTSDLVYVDGIGSPISDTDDSLQSIYVLDGRAYIVNTSGDSLLIFDLSDKSKVYDCNFGSSDDLRRVFVRKIAGEVYAYVLKSSGDIFYIFDVTPSKITGLTVPHDCDLGSPSIVGSLSNAIYGDSRSGLFVRGNYAYVNGGGRNLSITDISTNPKSLSASDIKSSSYIDGDANDLFVYGDYAYIPARGSGASPAGRLHIINVSNPASPALAGSVCISGGSCNDSKVYDVFVAPYPFQ